MVEPEDLKPGDLVGVNKDSYLVLEKLPAEYDSRVKAMEVDMRPTGNLLKSESFKAELFLNNKREAIQILFIKGLCTFEIICFGYDSLILTQLDISGNGDIKRVSKDCILYIILNRKTLLYNFTGIYESINSEFGHQPSKILFQ